MAASFMTYLGQQGNEEIIETWTCVHRKAEIVWSVLSEGEAQCVYYIPLKRKQVYFIQTTRRQLLIQPNKEIALAKV